MVVNIARTRSFSIIFIPPHFWFKNLIQTESEKKIWSSYVWMWTTVVRSVIIYHLWKWADTSFYCLMSIWGCFLLLFWLAVKMLCARVLLAALRSFIRRFDAKRYFHTFMKCTLFCPTRAISPHLRLCIVVDVFVCLFCWNCTEFHYFILVIPNCGWCWVQHKWLFANWQFLNTLSVHRSERNGLNECGMVERRNQNHRQAIARVQNENGTFCIVYNCITYHHRFKEREKSWQRRKGRAKKNERTNEGSSSGGSIQPSAMMEELPVTVLC